MKIRLFAALMIALLIVPMVTGCSLRTAETRLDAVTPDAAVPAPANEPASTEVQIPAYDPPATQAPAAAITKEEAEATALEHAGLTADQLLYLRTELDFDHGRQEYDVEFQIDRWEYDYEIHAETGEILSWDKDWDD